MTTFPMPTNYADHVLVASPSSVVRQRVLESLKSQGRHVEQVRGGAEALLHLENGLCQKLFLDRRLSDLDVEELTRTVQQRYPNLEVVIMGDVNANAEENACESRGEDDRRNLDDEVERPPLPSFFAGRCGRGRMSGEGGRK